MNSSHGEFSTDLKAEIRKTISRRRSEQSDPELSSRQIQQNLTQLRDWESARTVLFYVSVRDEVRTHEFLHQTLKGTKRVVVPYCLGNELTLIQLQSFQELSPGAYGILEPRADLRDNPNRRIRAGDIDLALIPGVAFDRCGGRLGHGRGYYDRLIPQFRCETPCIGLAYDCQIVDQVPVEPHDQLMDIIVTETRVIVGDDVSLSGR